MLSEISQAKKDMFHLCRILKKNPNQLQNPHPSSQIQRIDCWLSEVGGRVWVKWVSGVKMYKFPIIK